MGLEALRVFGSGAKGVWVCIGLTPQFSPKGITCSCPASVQLTQPKGSRDSCGSYGFWLRTANLGLQHKAGGPLPFIGILLTFGLMQTSPTARITDLQPSRSMQAWSLLHRLTRGTFLARGRAAVHMLGWALPPRNPAVCATAQPESHILHVHPDA